MTAQSIGFIEIKQWCRAVEAVIVGVLTIEVSGKDEVVVL